jgi:hypothetical protein
MASRHAVYAPMPGPLHGPTRVRKKQRVATPVYDATRVADLFDVFQRPFALTSPPQPPPAPAVPSKPEQECQTCYEIGTGIMFGRGMHAGKRRSKHFNCFECWERHIKVQLKRVGAIQFAVFNAHTL